MNIPQFMKVAVTLMAMILLAVSPGTGIDRHQDIGIIQPSKQLMEHNNTAIGAPMPVCNCSALEGEINFLRVALEKANQTAEQEWHKGFECGSEASKPESTCQINPECKVCSHG